MACMCVCGGEIKTEISNEMGVTKLDIKSKTHTHTHKHRNCSKVCESVHKQSCCWRLMLCGESVVKGRHSGKILKACSKLVLLHSAPRKLI